MGDWQQNPSNLESQGIRSRSSRRSVPPHQEGRRGPKASREEQEGQGLQVPTHSHREPNPQAGQIFQGQEGVAT